MAASVKQVIQENIGENIIMLNNKIYVGKLQNYNFEFLQYYNITIFQKCSIAKLQHCNIETLQHYNIKTLQHYSITILQYYNIICINTKWPGTVLQSINCIRLNNINRLSYYNVKIRLVY